MNELLSDTKAVLLWLFGIIGTLLGVLGVIALHILRGHIRRIDKLEAEVVRRAEFEQLRTDFQTKHVENVGALATGFNRIEALMKEDRGKADEHRDKLRNSIDQLGKDVAGLGTDVAVLKAEGLLDDAGRLRR